MNMHAVEKSDTWTHFLRLANQARVRNAGFDLPVTPQRTVSDAKDNRVFRSAISGMPRAGKLYERAETIPKKRSLLGSRFDAYA